MDPFFSFWSLSTNIVHPDLILKKPECKARDLLEAQVFVSEVELHDACGLYSSSKNIRLVRNVVGLRQPIEVFQEAKG